MYPTSHPSRSATKQSGGTFQTGGGHERTAHMTTHYTRTVAVVSLLLAGRLPIAMLLFATLYALDAADSAMR